MDSLTGVLGKLTDLNLFPSLHVDQALQTQDLLASSWIIDLHKLQDLRELVLFLVVDTLKNYFSRLRDQSVDGRAGRGSYVASWSLTKHTTFCQKTTRKFWKNLARDARQGPRHLAAVTEPA